MLHPDFLLHAARLRFRELGQEAERRRLVRLSRQVYEPIKVPPGFERLLRLKAEKRDTWTDLQKLAARIESHPRWRAHALAASEVASALASGARLHDKTSADDRRLERDLLHLNTERARLARIWCGLEGVLPDSDADAALTEPAPALGR